MAGDATLFAREDYVAEVWRIVDPVLKADPPVCVYEPGAWGPSEVDQKVSPVGGWQNSNVTRCSRSERPIDTRGGVRTCESWLI